MEDITVVDNSDERRFEIVTPAGKAGLVEYRANGAEIAFLHTEIDAAFEGKGLASLLARHALDGARARGLAVLPYCPFISGWIGKHPEYLDLVPAERRNEFSLPDNCGGV